MKPLARRLTACCFLLAAAGSLSAGPQDRPPRRSPVVDVFEKSRDAVVNLSTTRIQKVRTLHFETLLDDIFDFGAPRIRQRRVNSVGSGLIVHESGYIVTNAHVVARASDVTVTFADGRTATAEIIKADRAHDLAVLKVATRRPLPFIKLGRSDDIMVGETVIVIGNPLGLRHTVTAGIVSALDRDLRFSRDVVYRGLIQTDAAINPGNSGGPLLNVHAQLIGIATAIRGGAQNVSFAIPVARLWELLPSMLDIEQRQRVRFGLEVAGPDLKVVAVRPDSPAARAGLKPGDRVLRFNDDQLRNGIDYYIHLLEQTPGNRVRLTLQRGDETFSAVVPLQQIPPPDGHALADRLLGIKLEELSPRSQNRIKRNFSGLAAGLSVDQVEQRGPAGRARPAVHAGDIVLSVDGVPVRSLADVGLVLERVEPGGRIGLRFARLAVDEPFWTETDIHTRRRKP